MLLLVDYMSNYLGQLTKRRKCSQHFNLFLSRLKVTIFSLDPKGNHDIKEGKSVFKHH